MIITFTSASALALVAGCGDDTSGSSGTPQLVTTTTQLADIAGNVAGDRADVTGLLSPSSDPHDYEPKPSDAEAFVDASVVVESGGDLDAWAGDLVESSGTEAPVLTVLDQVDALGDDPHWWQNPQNAIIAAERVRDALSEADPDGADVYEANAKRYVGQIEDLDSAIEKCIGSLPADDRKLVTTHDALGYYADRYGLEIVGAAIPALTTQAQPSAGETAELVDLIRSEDVKAIFPESAVNADLEDAIASEAGASVGDTLYSDALGEEGSPAGTYLGSLASNTEAIVSGLSGGSASCAVMGVE